MSKDIEMLRNTAYLGGDSGAYLDALYESYLVDPNSVDKEWRDYFDSLPRLNGSAKEIPHSPVQNAFLELAKNGIQAPARAASISPSHEKKQMEVLHLVDAYRQTGHKCANLDPLQLALPRDAAELSPGYHGLTSSDDDTIFEIDYANSTLRLPLKDIIKLLSSTYCGSIGVEFMYISSIEERRWLIERIESVKGRPQYSSKTQRRVLERLTAAEGLERYLHNKYVGQKRFSLEGGDSLIPMMDELIQRSGAQGTKDIMIGMAHRGRLNMLVNILGKVPSDLFAEFEGKKKYDELASGDVKYHQGFSSDVKTAGGVMHLALAFNPSHLEIVSPVVVGSVRARQDLYKDKSHDEVLSILIHGDAAFAGQGVVMETFNMSQARGYKVGGSIHLVINNQVGFTTSNPQDARSTPYCTDIAKMVEAPVFHVNGDDVEATLFVMQLALDYRMAFHKDVVIDLVCYRRHGHNEADEPSATQPVMYKLIRQHLTPRAIYAEQLIAKGVITKEEDDALVAKYRDTMDAGSIVALDLAKAREDKGTQWKTYKDNKWTVRYNNKVPMDKLIGLARELTHVPTGFELQPQVAKIMHDREKMTAGELPVDWGYAENLAYATLVDEGFPIRISGQDCGRGTFAHRHAVLYEQGTNEAYIPLRHVKPNQPEFEVIDSLLSEEAVLGFEYGYATTDPEHLVIWEAQFGDFANGAQVVIDQFISSGEQKWGRLNGLVMLLPHGYEGMGPEHSSARLERYLQLCAEHNIQVCVPSTPAQAYHMLRRQMLRPYRKPLIVMTPKSLLRHRLAVSTLDELANGRFNTVIGEIDKIAAEKVRKVVLCSGKVYYELLTQRREKKIEDIAIVRIEQLYPFPRVSLREILSTYVNAKEIVWCQEEPKNQGAWYCSQHHMHACLTPGQTLSFAGRPASASPAAGYASLHNKQQSALIEEALS